MSTWWHANGRKMREIEYRDGDIDGQLIEWGPEGAVLLKETYQAGRKLAEKTSNYPDGSKKSQGMYLFAKDVEKTPDDWWNCKLVTTTKTGKDEKHGPWTTWHSNGQRQLEGTYEHDLQVGLFTWWHANGQKALEGRFETGKQDGNWTWWYATGQKSIQGEYAKGNPTGRWTWWKEDGKVAQSGRPVALRRRRDPATARPHAQHAAASPPAMRRRQRHQPLSDARTHPRNCVKHPSARAARLRDGSRHLTAAMTPSRVQRARWHPAEYAPQRGDHGSRHEGPSRSHCVRESRRVAKTRQNTAEKSPLTRFWRFPYSPASRAWTVRHLRGSMPSRSLGSRRNDNEPSMWMGLHWGSRDKRLSCGPRSGSRWQGCRRYASETR